MSQIIRNAVLLNKALEKQCYYWADKVTDNVKANIEEFIKGYYKEYSLDFYVPKIMERTV